MKDIKYVAGVAEFHPVKCEQELFCSRCDRPILPGENFALMKSEDSQPVKKGNYDLCDKCFVDMTGVSMVNFIKMYSEYHQKE